MSPRKKFGVVILLSVAAALPEWVWLGTHVLRHYSHEESESAGHDHEFAELARLATVLVHRHSHDGDVPDHEHHLSPSPACREAAPRHLDSVRTAALAAPETKGASAVEVRWAPGARRPAAGSGPPLLALLCTLRV